MKIFILIYIYRIYLKSYKTEVFSCQFAGFADILYITCGTALTCKKKYFFHSAVRNYLHLMLNLLVGKLHTSDLVIAVEAAVNAVVLTVVRYI